MAKRKEVTVKQFSWQPDAKGVVVDVERDSAANDMYFSWYTVYAHGTDTVLGRIDRDKEDGTWRAHSAQPGRALHRLTERSMAKVLRHLVAF